MFTSIHDSLHLEIDRRIEIRINLIDLPWSFSPTFVWESEFRIPRYWSSTPSATPPSHAAPFLSFLAPKLQLLNHDPLPLLADNLSADAECYTNYEPLYRPLTAMEKFNTVSANGSKAKVSDILDPKNAVYMFGSGVSGFAIQDSIVSSMEPVLASREAAQRQIGKMLGTPYQNIQRR